MTKKLYSGTLAGFSKNAHKTLFDVDTTKEKLLIFVQLDELPELMDW